MNEMMKVTEVCFPGQSEAVRAGLGRTHWQRFSSGAFRNISVGWQNQLEVDKLEKDARVLSREEFSSLPGFPGWKD